MIRLATPWLVVAAATPVLLAAWVYHPITRSYFYADDFVCLTSIVNDGFLRFVVRPFAGHNLLARNLVFYASHRLFGLHAELFFWTVLATHLLNVWLLFRVLQTLTASPALACLGAALWGTSPLHSGTLEWYSVFGQVLVATSLLAVLEPLTRLAATGAAVPARTACLWYVVVLLGTTCFGVGIGIALAFPAALFLMVPTAWRQPGVRAAYLALPLVTLAVYFALRRLASLVEPLSLDEILAVPGPGRVAPALAMLRELVTFAAAAFPRSFFFSATSYPDEASRLTLALFGAGVGVLSWRGGAATRRNAAAMTSLCLGAYFAIGLGRGFMARGAASLTFWATASRYHYVATIPIAVLACLALREVGRLPWLRTVPRVPLLLAAFVVGGYGFVHADFRLADYSSFRREFEEDLQGIVAEIHARPAGTTAYLENGTSLPQFLGPMPRRRLFPGRAAVFVLGYPDAMLDGRQARFLEPDPSVVAWYAGWPGTPLARLLVNPAAVRQR